MLDPAPLDNGERQVAPTLAGVRRDHVARYEWAARRLPLQSVVLDAACGVGYAAEIWARFGHTVVALDRSAVAIDYGRTHYGGFSTQFHVGGLPDALGGYVSDGFDAVVSFETIEHLVDPLPFLKEAARLAPRLIASVPNEAVFPYRCAANGFQGWAHHHRHYTRQEFAELLLAAGWTDFAWFGQAGPESEVEPDRLGRTLIVDARRAESRRSVDIPTAAADLAPAVETRAGPASVAIVGLGQSMGDYVDLTKRLGGRSALVDEVWGINAAGDVLACDRVFHMDDVAIQEARAALRPGGNIDAMLTWLKRHPGPVYTSVVRPGYPGLIAYPLEAVLNSAGDAPYFNNTAAYAIALAIHLKVGRVFLFGMDFTLPNVYSAEAGRACCEYWIGRGEAAGMEIRVPETSSLLGACTPDDQRFYGYDCVDVIRHDAADGGVRVELKPRDRIPTAAEIEARYDHNRHPNPLMRHAEEEPHP